MRLWEGDPRECVRGTDPVTSVKAAYGNLPNRETQRWKILVEHLRHVRGYTNDEVQVMTGIRLNSLTRRVTDLAQGDWLEDSGVEKPTRTGTMAVVWRVTEKAKRAGLELGLEVEVEFEGEIPTA